MMTKDETLRLALGTLNDVRDETFRLLKNNERLYSEMKVLDTIYEIKETLKTKDEPIGCAECGVSGGYALYCIACAEKFFGKGKEWVGLTDEHIINEADKFDWDKDCAVLFAKAIETKLKKKNH